MAEERAAALGSQYTISISFSTRIDCGMSSLMTLGKSPHHFSVTPLSWVIKGTFYLTNPVNLWIHKSLLSLSKLFTPPASKQKHMHLDGHPWEIREGWQSPALCLLEITTAAVALGCLSGKWRMKFPGDSSSSGESSCQWGEAVLVLPLFPSRWTSSAQAWSNSGAPNSTQVYTQAK